MYLFKKSEKSGIVVLIVAIVLLQALIWGWSFIFKPHSNGMIVDKEMLSFQKEVDSLKRLKIIESKPKIYPFNPNFLTDYRAYSLGIPTEAFDKLMVYRKHDKFVNSATEFQQITGVSDSLLQVISPFFKFPDWVNKSQSNPKSENNYPTTSKSFTNSSQPKIDLNLATKEQLMEVYGIGDKLSDGIINYRTKLQGFTFDNQIFEVWGVDNEVGERVLQKFVVMKKPQISPKNINDLTFKELLKVPYMDYELVKKIFNLKKAGGKIYSMEALKKIDGFPLDKFEKISLYLKAE